MREAGKLYGIPKSTLSDHVTGKSSKAYAGAPRGLSDEDEVEIVITCQVLAEMGFPLNVYYVGTVIKDYLEQQGKQNPFGDTGMPGRDWWSRFLSRHSSLAQRRPQHLSKKRAQANDPIVLDEWFERVRKLFASSKLDKFESEAIAERLWNCDETGFCTAVASKQVLAKKGSKAVYEVGGGSGREYITVLGKPNLYTKPISLHNFQVVDQHLAEGCHHSLCIKQNTCMIHGSKEVLLVQHTVYLPLDGWRVLTSLAGLSKFF